VEGERRGDRDDGVGLGGDAGAERAGADGDIEEDERDLRGVAVAIVAGADRGKAEPRGDEAERGERQHRGQHGRRRCRDAVEGAGEGEQRTDDGPGGAQAERLAEVGGRRSDQWSQAASAAVTASAEQATPAGTTSRSGRGATGRGSRRLRWWRSMRRSARRSSRSAGGRG